MTVGELAPRLSVQSRHLMVSCVSSNGNLCVTNSALQRLSDGGSPSSNTISHENLITLSRRCGGSPMTDAKWRKRPLVSDIVTGRTATDALIADAAIVYDLTIVTRSVTDFKDTGANLVISWFEF
jgi:hypothetical protein